MKNYRQRIADRLLARKLASKGAVLINGPKWCGKTTTAEQIAASVLYMGNPDEQAQNQQLADINSAELLAGATPRLIDEWQTAPKLWDAIRFAVDHREGHGQFILTGSAVPTDTDQIIHSGTGRFAWLTMRPMSLWESGDSTGTVSLEQLFSTPEQISGQSQLQLRDMAWLTCRGGWPDAVNLDREYALDPAIDYYDAVVGTDVSRVDGIKRDTERAKRLMRSYVRHQGAQATIKSIRNDMLLNDTDTLDEDTVSSYINALKKIFVIEDMPAWNPNLRSKAAIRTSDTRYFVDPSIATAAIGAGPDDLIRDLETFGLLFETMAVRDLRVYADALSGHVYHYRDSNGLECDAVIHRRNGTYGLVEIKLGGSALIEAGVRTLLKLAATLDTTRMPAPSFMMILTATGSHAYRREDGIYIVPIGCLKE